MNLANATLTCFKSVFFMTTTLCAVRINYNLDNLRTSKTICLKCNFTRIVDLHVKCFFSFLLLDIFYSWARTNLLFSCCDVPATVLYILSECLVFF